MMRALSGEMHADPRGLVAWLGLAVGYAAVVRVLLRRSRGQKGVDGTVIRLTANGRTGARRRLLSMSRGEG